MLLSLRFKNVVPYPGNKRSEFVASFYGEHGDVDRLIEANEWLRSTYAPHLSLEAFADVLTEEGEHSPFTIALGALLKDIQEELSSKRVV